MKKILLLTFVVCIMNFTFVINTFAATMYLDSMNDGTQETRFNTNELNQFITGMEISVDESSKVSLEYQRLTVDNNPEAITTSLWMKYGRALVQNEIFQAYGNLSTLIMNGNSVTGDVKYSPIMLGIETNFNLSEKMSIKGILDYAVTYKDYETNSSNKVDADYWITKLKFDYMLTEKYGIALGYMWSELKIDDNLSSKNTDKGYTLGLVFRY